MFVGWFIIKREQTLLKCLSEKSKEIPGKITEKIYIMNKITFKVILFITFKI